MIKAVVNLKTINENVQNIKSAIGDKKIYPVVKANAYGHGMLAVANSLSSVVDGFCVANINEGVALRQGGIEKNVFVLMPDDGYYRAIAYNLTLSVTCFREMYLINKYAKMLNKVAEIQLKINTGMNRFGFDNVADVIYVLEKAEDMENVKIIGVFSHLYNAKDVKSSYRQLNKFKEYSRVVRSYYPNVIRHISASGGVLDGEDFYLDAVRVGLMIYGYKPFKSDVIQVKPALSVYSGVICTRKIDNRDNFLYDNFKSEGGYYSIIDGGYADGFCYNNKITNNHPCMNCMSIKGNYDGFYAVLDENNNAEVIAKKNKTIPYEILCDVTKNAVFEYVR